MVDVIKSFAQATFSKELGPYDVNIQPPQTTIQIWRMVISHPQLPYVHHNGTQFLNVIIDKICENICTRTGSLSMMHSFLRFMESSLLWSLRCQHNVSFVIPYLIRAGTRIFSDLANRRAYFDFIIQMLKLIESFCQTAMNQSKRNLYLNFDAPPQLNTKVILRDCWMQLGSVFIEILDSHIKSPTSLNTSLLKRRKDEYAEYLSDEESADFSHHNAMLTDLSTRDSKLPMTTYLDLILERIKKDYAVSSIVTSETLSKKSSKFFNSLTMKQKSRVVYGNLYYMMESYEKSLQQYEELNMANNASVDILFCIQILQYRVSTALNIVQKQFEAGYDIMRSKIEDIPLRGGSILKKDANLNIIYAMASILLLHYQERKTNILPPLFAQSNQAFKLKDHGKILQLISPSVIDALGKMEEFDCYYRPLSQSKLGASIRNVCGDIVGKAIVVRLLLALGHVDEAIRFCLQFSSQRHLLSIIYCSVMGTTEPEKQPCVPISSKLQQYNVQMIENAYSSVIRKSLREKSSEVHRILNTAQNFLPDSLNLRLTVIREYLQRVQDSFRSTGSTMFKKVLAGQQVPYLERMRHFILTKSKNKEENRRVQLYEAEKFANILTVYSMGFSSLESKLLEGDNALIDQSFSPLYDSMQVFCTAPGSSVKELLSEYRNALTRKEASPYLLIYLYEFRHFCRYMWYAYLKDRIESAMKIINPFKAVYRPQVPIEGPANDLSKEHVLIELAELCAFLLDFTEIHSKVFLQGSLITVLALLSSSATIRTLISRYLANESDIALNLKKRYLQLEKRITKDFSEFIDQDIVKNNVSQMDAKELELSGTQSPNGAIQNSSEMQWKCESNSNYWQFLQESIEMLASDEVVQHFQKQSNAKNPESPQPLESTEKINPFISNTHLWRRKSQIDRTVTPSAPRSEPQTASPLLVRSRVPPNPSPVISTVDLHDAPNGTSIDLIVDVLSTPEPVRVNPAMSLSPSTATNDRVHIPKLDIRNISDDGNLFAETLSNSPQSNFVSGIAVTNAQKFNPRTPSRSTRTNSVVQAMKSIQRSASSDDTGEGTETTRRGSVLSRYRIPKLNIGGLPRNMSSNLGGASDEKSTGSADRGTFVLDL